MDKHFVKPQVGKKPSGGKVANATNARYGNKLRNVDFDVDR